MNWADKIADNLWWGGQPKDIDEYKFVIALNHCPKYHIDEGTLVIIAPLQDGYKIPNVQMLHRLADMVNEYTALGKTYVHCTAGINRSSLIVALALIKRGGKPQDVVKLMRQVRGSDVLSNEVFEQWLYEESQN